MVENFGEIVADAGLVLVHVAGGKYRHFAFGALAVCRCGGLSVDTVLRNFLAVNSGNQASLCTPMVDSSILRTIGTLADAFTN